MYVQAQQPLPGLARAFGGFVGVIVMMMVPRGLMMMGVLSYHGLMVRRSGVRMGQYRMSHQAHQQAPGN